MKRITYCLLLQLFLIGCTQNKPVDPLDYVDPFIGTGAHGHTYPGATSPYGAVQLSPDTRKNNWDACSGYHYSDSTIIGFSHTHLSGTGAIDLGDILFHPTSKVINPDEKRLTEPPFLPWGWKATPGYYSVHFKRGYPRWIDCFNTCLCARYTKKRFAGNTCYWHGHLLTDETIDTLSIHRSGPNEIAGMRKPVAGYQINICSRSTILWWFQSASIPKISASNCSLWRIKRKSIGCEGGHICCQWINARENLENDVNGFDFDAVHKKPDMGEELNSIVVESSDQKVLKLIRRCTMPRSSPISWVMWIDNTADMTWISQ